MSAATSDADKPKSSSRGEKEKQAEPAESLVELRARRKREKALKREERERACQLRLDEWIASMRAANLEAGIVEGHDEYELMVARRSWNNLYASRFGPFEATTVVPPMRYSFMGEAAVPAQCEDGLQIFSIKLVKLIEEEGLHWPLHVYGLIATRDMADPRRNILFNRTRDDCQILTQEDPFLALTGPSRAVQVLDPVRFEFLLRAKGKTESEDKALYFRCYTARYFCTCLTRFVSRVELRYKRSHFELSFAGILNSVEATIIVQIIDGSWPDNLRALIACRTVSIDDEQIVLLDSKDGRVHADDLNKIELSRRVVSVELNGQLKVEVVASKVDDSKNSVVDKVEASFTPMRRSVSRTECDLGFCKIKICVAWSLFYSLEPSPCDGPEVGCKVK